MTMSDTTDTLVKMVPVVVATGLVAHASRIGENKRRVKNPHYSKSGVLSTAKRERLPKSAFAIPEKAPGPGSYPIPDESHARNALARVSQHGTPAEKKRVKIAVTRKFPEIGTGIKIIKKHDDGDLTIRKGRTKFVVTTSGETFRKVKSPLIPKNQLRSLRKGVIYHTKVGSHIALSRHLIRHRRK